MAFTASAVWEVQTSGLDDFQTVSATVAAGGTGYSVNDVLTVTGGTSTTTATFTVATVSGGVVLTVTPLNTGHYTVLPTNPASTTGGAGTCTLTITWNAGGNGGGFDTGVAGFPTDGAATVATSAAPVFTSASYNFVAGDAGAWIYIKSGTNWTAGWYKIASVAANAATLNATIGAAVLASGTPNTVVGCATGVGPWTGATWGIDYSQSTAGQVSFTDMVVGATTTQFTSVLKPVAKNYIGNIICVTSGATVQRVAVVSTSGTTATCDKTLGTAAQVGVGTLGGPLASPGQASLLKIASNTAWVKSGTYSIISATTNIPGGCVSDAVGGPVLTWEGYGTVRGDLGTAPLLQASGISTAVLFTVTSGATAGYTLRNITVDGASLTSTQGFALARVNHLGYKLRAINCTNIGINQTAGGNLVLCSATNVTGGTAGIVLTGSAYLCESYSNTVLGFSIASVCVFCLAYSNTGASSDGFSGSGSNLYLINCVAYANGRDGVRITGGSPHFVLNSIFESNVGTGINPTTAAVGVGLTVVNCGVRGNGTDVSANVGRVLNSIITGSASFFIAAASFNFALNNNTGAGAAARAAGIPGAFPSGTTTGYQDIGAAQSRVPWQTTNLSGGLIG